MNSVGLYSLSYIKYAEGDDDFPAHAVNRKDPQHEHKCYLGVY